MLIKNTDGSYCKIKDIKVSGLTAYITVIIYSAIPQTSEDKLGNVHRVFSFYLKDLNSKELYRLSHNNYWIDRNNNYNNDNNNIDINMHKEIILEVDITNTNKSEMIDKRWIRKCNLILIDHTTNSEEAWVSEDITLISKEIELPIITNLIINKTKNNFIECKFDYSYESQEDFNYINKNLITVISIKSIYTNDIIETFEFPHSKQKNNLVETISFTSTNKYTSPVSIDINTQNLTGDTLTSFTQFFNPDVSLINLAINNTDIKYIKSATVKDNDMKVIKNITYKE